MKEMRGALHSERYFLKFAQSLFRKQLPGIDQSAYPAVMEVSVRCQLADARAEAEEVVVDLLRSLLPAEFVIY